MSRLDRREVPSRAIRARLRHLHRRRYFVVAALSFASALSSSARAEDEPSSFRFEVRGYAMLDYVQAFQGVDPNW